MSRNYDRDHDWKPVKTYSADEYYDRPGIIEEERVFLNSTWLRWKCEDCGRVLQVMAPCEWHRSHQIRSSVLNWSYDITYDINTYCCGEYMR